MNIGITGTREGLSITQRESLINILSKYNHVGTQLHTGCCVGVDTQVAELVLEIRYDKIRLIGHPPIKKHNQGATDMYDMLLPEKNYLERDRIIVNSTAMLIACPLNLTTQKGGTWYTINYAQKKNKPVIILI